MGAAVLYGPLHTSPGNADPQLSPYNPKVQNLTLRLVAELMHIQIDKNKPIPKVVEFSKVDKSIFLQTWNYIPEKEVHHYHWIKNIIILSTNARVDVLAHEYVHYFQFYYQDAKSIIHTTEADRLEVDAAVIQNQFRNILKDITSTKP